MAGHIEPTAVAEAPAEAPTEAPTDAAVEADTTVRVQLESLPDPKIPGDVCSIFAKKFHLLDKMDERRLEVDNKKKNVSHICSFCNNCFNLSWQKSKRGLDGKGTYDTTKVLRHLEEERKGGGKECTEILELVAKKAETKKRKMELLTNELKMFHSDAGQ